MSAPPFFSVLVAAYDQAAYVAATLDSVAAQRCRDWELVIVDDGSTDGTGEAARAWARRFRASGRTNRVEVVRTANGGQSAALERAAEAAAGRWFCLLDSDDLWLPEKLDEVRRAAEADGEAGMIVHPLWVIDERGRRTGDVRPMRAKLSEGDLRDQLRRTARHVAPATSGVALRADVFRRLVPMATRGYRDAADAYLTLGASLLAPVRALQAPLAEYRMHAAGNYLKRFATAEGLRYTVELEAAIVRAFGLEAAAARNPYSARNRFALARYEGGARDQLRAYRALAAATWNDTGFGAPDRALLLGFWTACLLAPRPAFAALWRAFQRRHTGIDRIVGRGAPTAPA